MNKKQLVSIIIPTYDNFDKIHSCLYSLLAQTYTNLEVLVVNEGDNELLLKTLIKKMKQDSRIRVYQSTHRGLNAARNYGLKRAQGEYVLFMDSNGTLDSRGIEFLMAACDCGEGGKLPDMLLFGIHWHKRRNYLENQMPSSFKGNQREFVRQPFYKSYRQGLIQPLWNKLLRREFLLEQDLYFEEDLSVLDDLLFSVQAISQAQEIVALDQAFYHHYDSRKNSLILQSNSVKEETLLRICQVILGMSPLHPRHREFYCKDTVMRIIRQLRDCQKRLGSPLKKYRRVKWLLQNQQLYEIAQTAVGDNRREKQKLRLLKLLMKVARNKASLKRSSLPVNKSQQT